MAMAGAAPARWPWPDGLLACGLGVLGFSGTASATRAVVLGAGPWVAAIGRVTVAAAAVILVASVAAIRARRAAALGIEGRTKAPDVDAALVAGVSAPESAGPVGAPAGASWTARDRLQLVLVSAAIVTVFPVLHAAATVNARAQEMTLLGGVLPLLTAVLGKLRTRQPTPAAVWLGAGLGTLALCAFAFSRGDPQLGRSFLLGAGAIGAAAYGYAEGALLARRFGAYAVISRAVLVGLVLDALIVLLVRPTAPSWDGLTRPAPLLGLLYLGLVSMLLAYVAWYKGLARVGVTRGALVQLGQVPLGLVWSWLLLREPVGGAELATAAAVLVSLFLALRTPRPGARRRPQSAHSPGLSTALPLPLPLHATSPSFLPSSDLPSQRSSTSHSQLSAPASLSSSSPSTSSLVSPEARS